MEKTWIIYEKSDFWLRVFVMKLSYSGTYIYIYCILVGDIKHSYCIMVGTHGC